MAIQEVITEWQSENSPGGLSIMYFDDAESISLIRSSLDTMFTSMASKLDTLTTWTVRTSGKIIDETTGILTGFWNEPTAATGVGTLSGIPVPNASQALLRWRTATIVNGRLLQGRTFVPGVGTAAVDGGQLSSATLVQFDAALAAFIVAMSTSFLVWHRPLGGTPGGAFNVNSGSTWNEMAVQRRRR